MKKKLITIALMLSFCVVFSQSVVFPLNENGEIEYSQVIEVNGKSKDQLYLNSKVWFVEFFKSANDVLQLDDKENGKLIGKGNMTINKKGNGANVGFVTFNIQIDVKDNKYKYTINNLWHDPGENPFTSPGDLRTVKSGIQLVRSVWDDIKLQTDNNIKALISQLETQMKSNKATEDW